MGKVAIVTGASSGIGEATARLLARQGASVVLAARAEDKLKFLEREITAAAGQALAIPTDVADEEAVRALVSQAVERFGSLDILVNNAGVGVSGRIENLRMEDLRYVFEVNLFGAVSCIQASLPYMKAGGRIINVSSVVGKRAVPMVGGYCATKFAMNAVSDTLRMEIAGRGISVTSVYPGTTRTDFSRNSRRNGYEERGWRPGGVSPERVAERIARAAEHGDRDIYITLPDRLFAAFSTVAPRVTDRVLRLWVKK